MSHDLSIKIISSEVCLASATWLGSNALKWWHCRGPPPPREPCVLGSAHLCNRLFLETVIRLIMKCILHNFFAQNTSASCQKYAGPYFHHVANKGLVYTIMTTSRRNLMAQAILLHTKLCKIYRVYCLNYILNESQVDTKTVTSWLVCFNTIKYFSSEYK